MTVPCCECVLVVFSKASCTSTLMKILICLLQFMFLRATRAICCPLKRTWNNASKGNSLLITGQKSMSLVVHSMLSWWLPKIVFSGRHSTRKRQLTGKLRSLRTRQRWLVLGKAM